MTIHHLQSPTPSSHQHALGTQLTSEPHSFPKSHQFAVESSDTADFPRPSIEAAVIEYGARLMSVRVTDRRNRPVNVLLGLPKPEDYQVDNAFLGAIIGRNANRIAGAKCCIKGVEYRLAANERSNNTHSGPDGFDRRIWRVTAQSRDHVTLTLHSPHGDQGFPGTMHIQATYRVGPGTLDLLVEAECDHTTVANMTSHVYWNLAGESHSDVLGHELMIPTGEFHPTDGDFIPLPHVPVHGTAMDFHTPRPIGEAMRLGFAQGDQQLSLAHGYNHAFVFKDAAGEVDGAAKADSVTGMRPVAVLSCPDTGLRMTEYANVPAVLAYSAGFLEGIVGSGGVTYGSASGIALEPGFVPNVPQILGRCLHRVIPAQIGRAHV